MNNLLRPFGKGKGKFIHPDEARRRLDEIVVDAPTAPAHPIIMNPTITTPTDGFYIEELPDRYRLNNVNYLSASWQIDWSKELLDGGETYTQAEWVLQTTQAYALKRDFYLPSAKLYYLTMKTLCNAREMPLAQIVLRDTLMNILVDDFKQWRMMTSTRLIYNPAPEKDRIIHQVYETGIEELLDLTGRSGEVTAPGVYDDVLQSLLDSRSVEEVVGVSQLMFSTSAWFARLDLKPPIAPEPRILTMGNAKDGFEIIALGGLDKKSPARGVIAKYD